MRPEVNAGPMARSCSPLNVAALMGSSLRRPSSGWANAAKERHNKSGIAFMDGSITHWKLKPREQCGSRRRANSDPMNPLESRPAVEIAIETENRSDTMSLHDRDVDRIAG